MHRWECKGLALENKILIYLAPIQNSNLEEFSFCQQGTGMGGFKGQGFTTGPRGQQVGAKQGPAQAPRAHGGAQPQTRLVKGVDWTNPGQAVGGGAADAGPGL